MANLWMTCGLPGSGKSTWAKANLKKCVYISRDEIRFGLVDEDEDYFSHENEVYRVFIHEIQDCLNQGKDVVADATHLNWSSRSKLLKNLSGFDTVSIVYFDVPIDVCIKRNAERKGRACVPENVIKQMTKHFSDPRKDSYHYDQIIIITERG